MTSPGGAKDKKDCTDFREDCQAWSSMTVVCLPVFNFNLKLKPEPEAAVT